MTEKVTDGAVLAHIQKLVTEEEALYSHGAPSDADRDRLNALNVELDRCWERLGPDVGVQGNLDPVVLFAPLAEIARHTRRILGQAANRPGHIFNLGHGILPHTPVDHVRALVQMVHELSAR